MCGIMGYLGSTLREEDLKPFLDRTVSRGPDMQRFVTTEGAVLGFNRLSIMGLTEEGMQPFSLGENCIVCNGEIYGFRKLKKELEETHGYTFKSDSDCEILLPMYEQFGIEHREHIDAVLKIHRQKDLAIAVALEGIALRLQLLAFFFEAV